MNTATLRPIEHQFPIEGMTCTSRVTRDEKALKSVTGVNEVRQCAWPWPSSLSWVRFPAVWCSYSDKYSYRDGRILKRKWMAQKIGGARRATGGDSIWL